MRRIDGSSMVGDWNNADSGDQGTVLIGVFPTNADWTGITDISQTFYNDNDNIWVGGVWVFTQADHLIYNYVELNPLPPGPNTATVVLDLTGKDVANVFGYGILIGSVFQGDMFPSPGDKFHMSSSPVPLPVAAWLLGSGLVGLLALRRRFRH
jgi:hypothetical protein